MTSISTPSLTNIELATQLGGGAGGQGAITDWGERIWREYLPGTAEVNS